MFTNGAWKIVSTVWVWTHDLTVIVSSGLIYRLRLLVLDFNSLKTTKSQIYNPTVDSKRSSIFRNTAYATVRLLFRSILNRSLNLL